MEDLRESGPQPTEGGVSVKERLEELRKLFAEDELNEQVETI